MFLSGEKALSIAVLLQLPNICDKLEHRHKISCWFPVYLVMNQNLLLHVWSGAR